MAMARDGWSAGDRRFLGFAQADELSAAGAA